MIERGATRPVFERVAAQERWLVIAGLGIVVALGLWTALASGDALMSFASPVPGTIAHAAVLFVMWWTMMMAMMLPSAAPAVLVFGAIGRKLAKAGSANTACFVAGYLAVWTAFSLAAVLLQSLTADVVRLNGMMALTSRIMGGLLLAAAGIYQFTTLKQACLKHCQTPFMYLAHHWRNGRAGAFRLGLSHGIYCLGCCWVLMLLLFYGGVMELTWIVGLALYVAAEKLIPARLRFDRIAGIILMAWGAWVLASTLS